MANRGRAVNFVIAFFQEVQDTCLLPAQDDPRRRRHTNARLRPLAVAAAAICVRGRRRRQPALSACQEEEPCFVGRVQFEWR